MEVWETPGHLGSMGNSWVEVWETPGWKCGKLLGGSVGNPLGKYRKKLGSVGNPWEVFEAI